MRIRGGDQCVRNKCPNCGNSLTSFHNRYDEWIEFLMKHCLLLMQIDKVTIEDVHCGFYGAEAVHRPAARLSLRLFAPIGARRRKGSLASLFILYSTPKAWHKCVFLILDCREPSFNTFPRRKARECVKTWRTWLCIQWHVCSEPRHSWSQR